MKNNISRFLAYFIVFSLIKLPVDLLLLGKEPKLQYFGEWMIMAIIFSALMVPVYNYLEKKKASGKNS